MMTTPFQFADKEHIRKNLKTRYDPETETIRYKYENAGIQAVVLMSVEDMKRSDGMLLDFIVNQLAKQYNVAITREMERMNFNGFWDIICQIRNVGGTVAVNEYDTYGQPMTVIKVPTDRVCELFRPMPVISMSTPIPEVYDVEFFNDRATVVTFTDGTKTRCVCDENDTFNESVGIAYCLFKRALGGGGKGHRRFNDLMRQARWAIEDKEAGKKLAEKMVAEEKRIEEKRIEKARKRRMKKLQEKVNVIREAIRQEREAEKAEKEPLP